MLRKNIIIVKKVSGAFILNRASSLTTKKVFQKNIELKKNDSSTISLAGLNKINQSNKLKRSFATNCESRSFYEILGVPSHATSNEIKKAYFEKAKEFHPDRNSSNPMAKKEFQKIAVAYDTLKDSTSRAQYDLSLKNTFYGNSNFAKTSYYDRPVDPIEVFTQVWKELGLKDFETHFGIILSEANHALTEIKTHNNFKPAWNFAVKRKGIMLGIIIPVAALLRFPAVFPVLLRSFTLVPLLFIKNIIQANPTFAWHLLSQIWFRIVTRLEKNKKRD